MNTTNDRSIHLHLLPRLRRAGSEPAAPAVTVVPEVLEGVVVLEYPESEPVLLTAADLARLGLTAEDAWERALENLGRRSDPSRWQRVATVPGMQIYLPGQGDAASRALLLSELGEVPFDGILLSIPTPHQLLAVPLDRFEALQAIEVLVGATRYAVENSSEPLSDQLFWFDGSSLRLVSVEHRADGAEIHPPPELLAAVERLATMSMVAAAGEA